MTEALSREPPWPEEWPELVPFTPFVHCVWADGVLTAEELSECRRTVAELNWLSDRARDVLGRWLDPEAPPTPTALKSLRARIRAAELDDPERAARSLTDLGLALARASDEKGVWTGDDAERALRELERSLGCVESEAARSALGRPPARPARPEPATTSFEGPSLRAFMDRDRREIRDRVSGLLTAPVIEPGLGPTEYRERVLEAVRFLAEEGLGRLAYPEAYGGAADPTGAVVAFETLAYGDLSVLVKFGVQFGLWGGSVLQLGTERHHEAYLAAIGRLELPGCYAMTEIGHGSNVRDLETTATYDERTDELVVHTPHESATKDWIGNAAAHGRMATVFARLIVGGEDHGVHAVLVPLRDEGLDALPGVRLEDCGLKEGLNGVDNGRIAFDHVRVPRTNLLDRFATIDETGRYESPIPSPGRRFFRMLRTLVMGRVSIAAAAVSATKVGLTVAVRYTAARRQFGPEDGAEQPILDYPLIQRALLPRLATTFGLHFAIRELQGSFDDPERSGSAELEVAAAGLKAYASAHCVETLQACREACGGWGYGAESGFAALKADTDVFTTFEGANLVLYQLVAKGLLSQFREEMGDLTLRRAVRYLADRAETALSELNPVVTRRADEEHLLDPEFHASALRYREERLLRSAASRIRARLEDGMDSFQAVKECQDHLVTLARAHVERVLGERLREAVARAPGPGLSEAVGSVAALYALARVEAHRGWYLESGYVEPNKARAIRTRVTALCAEVREYAELLVEGFGVPDAVLPERVRAGAR